MADGTKTLQDEAGSLDTSTQALNLIAA